MVHTILSMDTLCLACLCTCVHKTRQIIQPSQFKEETMSGAIRLFRAIFSSASVIYACALYLSAKTITTRGIEGRPNALMVVILFSAFLSIIAAFLIGMAGLMYAMASYSYLCSPTDSQRVWLDTWWDRVVGAWIRYSDRRMIIGIATYTTFLVAGARTTFTLNQDITSWSASPLMWMYLCGIGMQIAGATWLLSQAWRKAISNRSQTHYSGGVQI